MKTCEVTLEIVSPELDLTQISAILGDEGSAFSHDKGTPRGRNASWDVTVWKTTPLEAEEASINTCLSQLLRQPAAIALRTKRHEFRDASAYVNVAVFHQSLNCSLSITSAVLQQIGNSDLDLVMSTYPCE